MPNLDTAPGKSRLSPNRSQVRNSMQMASIDYSTFVAAEFGTFRSKSYEITWVTYLGSNTNEKAMFTLRNDIMHRTGHVTKLHRIWTTRWGSFKQKWAVLYNTCIHNLCTRRMFMSSSKNIPFRFWPTQPFFPCFREHSSGVAWG